MKLLIACLTFVVFLTSANAQIKLPGSCPNVAFQDLDLNLFLHPWYIQSSYEYARIDGNPIKPVCMVNYQKLKGATLIFTKEQVNNKAMEKLLTPVTYLGGGKFEVIISATKNDFVARNYGVLATDYDNYAIRYSCRNLGDKHEIFVGIITATPNPSDVVMKKARDIIAEKKLSLKYLTATRSKECDVKI